MFYIMVTLYLLPAILMHDARPSNFRCLLTLRRARGWETTMTPRDDRPRRLCTKTHSTYIACDVRPFIQTTTAAAERITRRKSHKSFGSAARYVESFCVRQ